MTKIVFNPDYFLRHDIKRTFIINKYSLNNSTQGWFSMIHPIHAMVFSFFTKNESFEVVLNKISEFLSMTTEEVRELITPFIENFEDVYVTFDNTQFSIPKNVLIKSEKEINYDLIYTPEDFYCDEFDFLTKRYLKAPLNITFMPNNRCVTECIYCYADKCHNVESYLPFNRLLEILDEAKNVNVLDFSVVGGEIFTYPYWRELLKGIKDRKFGMMRISTKVPITLDDIKYLKSIGIQQIQVSIDSLIFEEMALLVNVDIDYYNKIKNTLKNLSEENFDIKIATILTKYNSSVESINSIYNFISKIKVDSWSISPGFESLYKPEQSFRAEKDVLYKLFEYIEELHKNSKFEILIDKTFIERNYGDFNGGSMVFEGATCSALYSHIFILPDGQVTMCEQLYWNPHFIIGDITNQSIVEVWNSERVKWFLNLKKEMLQSANPCSTCDIFDKCYNNMNRCWAEVIKAYGKENWDYPDPRCSLAPEMINNLNF